MTTGSGFDMKNYHLRQTRGITGSSSDQVLDLDLLFRSFRKKPFQSLELYRILTVDPRIFYGVFVPTM